MRGDDAYNTPPLREAFNRTSVIRKPITGIVSDYHELPYILVTPNDANPLQSVEVNGTIKVSPRLVISPTALADTFGDIFDPETLDSEIVARTFSFMYSRKKNVKLESAGFRVSQIEEKAEEYVRRVLDRLLMQENIRTGLIFGPRFRYYPVSLDKFITEILDREFNL